MQQAKLAKPVRSSRIPSLDGFRGIAIVIVVLGHIPAVTGQIFSGLPLSIGYFGLRSFFVLSGFLITGLLINEHEKEGGINLLHFYWRRALRIFPTYYAYLFICLALTYTGLFGKQHIAPFYSSLKYAAAYITNYRRKEGWIVAHTWSLSVEEQFYLLWPGIVAFFGLLKSRRFAFAAILLCPVIRLILIAAFHGKVDGAYTIGNSFETACDSLATGCFLGLTLTSIRKSRFYSWIMNTKVFAVIIIGIAGIQMLSIFDHGYPFIFYTTVGVALLNIGIAVCMIRWMDRPEKGIAKLLNSRSLIFMGRISYSIYLWQNIFMFNVFESKWTAFPLSILWVSGAALASFYLIENPFFAIRHYLDERILKQRAVTTVAVPASAG